MAAFDNIPQLPDDPIFKLPTLYSQDPRPKKANLGIGVYQNEEGQPVVLSSVRKAEKLLLEKLLGKSYQPIDGDADYVKETTTLIFGAESNAIKEKRAFTLQTVGGANALRIGAEFLCALVSKKIFISDPTWVNHKNIFSRAGMEVLSYPYYDSARHNLDFPSIKKAIQSMPAGSIILLQACGHNPTGVDPTIEQWKELSSLIKQQKVIPFFDLAYQGFANGLDEDAAAIRLFADEGHELLVAYSYSKNMGLYGERVGALALIADNQDACQRAASQLRQIVRGIYSTAPLQGGRIAALILKTPELRTEWIGELQKMRDRLHQRRLQLADHLDAHSESTNYQFLIRQQGMFSFCGLTPEHVQELIQKYAIYLPADGRINIAGLNVDNLEYVSRSILETTAS